MRFYDVNSGEIAVSGHNIMDMTRSSLRSNYGMVLQETWLKKGTIRENICMGKPDATEEEMIAAAKAAHAHSFIRRLPQGYDTCGGWRQSVPGAEAASLYRKSDALSAANADSGRGNILH